jgi:hypothetical protein
LRSYGSRQNRRGLAESAASGLLPVVREKFSPRKIRLKKIPRQELLLSPRLENLLLCKRKGEEDKKG